MKKLTYIIAIATSVLAMASCQKEQNVTNSDNLTVVSFSTSEIQTKTAFGDKTAEGKYPTLWTGDEKVGVAYNSGSVNKKNITSSTDGKSASFEIAIAQDANATNHNFYVISPAEAFLGMNNDGSKGNIQINASQTPGEGTCDPAAQVIAASHKSETFDTQINLAFSHVTAYGNLSIGLPEGAGAVSNISLTGSENIAGRFYYDFNGALSENSASSTISLLTSKVSDIFFACAPADLSGGKLDITVTTNNGTYEKSIDLTGKTLKFESGKISKFTVNGFAKKEAPASWIATDLADITAADEVVITMAKGESVYALSAETDAKSNNPQAVLVTVKNGELTAAPADNLVWNIANDKGNLTIYPNGQTDKWLFAVSGDTKVKVGNSATNKIFTLDATTKYLKNTGANRYLGVYIDKADWRAYANTSNIAGQTLCFYVKGTPKTALETPANLQVSAAKVVSWDAVSGAASYNVTIGTETYTSNTNSYDATAITDDYYNVDVVAVPSDKENYKNSSAATLTGAKFGTPKFTTPELAEGAIDESSIGVNMTVDARATNGCTCEIYKGETLVESKTITASYVVFNGLEDGVTYTIKVNAIAVEGEKPYAASDVASIELKTKPAQHVSNVTAAGTYTIKGLTVYAVANPSVAIAGDNTGYILVYKSSHGLNVGDTFNVAGTVKEFNGVWEFDSPSITGQAVGGTPVYPEAVEADEAYLSSYGTGTKIEYVHAKGVQSGKNIKVGTKTLYLSAENPETDGKNVEVTGFVYGYNTSFSSASFVATSIQLDDSFPYLSVDQSSKVWAADATDAFIVKVAVNSEADWTVTPETLPWATIAVDKAAGTITITPNGANTNETANEATLTVTHASDASLKEEITLKQNAAGGAAALVEYVSTFIDKELNTKENTMTWTSSITATSFENASPNRGVQFGAKKGTFTIKGTGHSSKVKKISVIISTNSAGNTISATVGGVAIGKQISLKKDNNYEIVFESTTELSGDIVFNVNDKDKSVYIKSITVNPAN